MKMKDRQESTIFPKYLFFASVSKDMLLTRE
jgi:hypothetical protein